MSFEGFGGFPIVGPTDSVMRFMRGEMVWPEEIEVDTSRSDVWSVTREQYERWRILYRDPASHPPLDSFGDTTEEATDG